MIRAGDRVFVDTGAWIAMAITADVRHPDARAIWESIIRAGARPVSSVPVILETFTYLDRKGSRAIAGRWREGLSNVERLEVLACTAADLDQAWSYIEKKSFHKLSLVDATSFVLMKRSGLRTAFAFDTHFGQAGFHYVEVAT